MFDEIAIEAAAEAGYEAFWQGQAGEPLRWKDLFEAEKQTERDIAKAALNAALTSMRDRGMVREQAAYVSDEPYALYHGELAWRCNGYPWDEKLRQNHNFPVTIIKRPT